MAFRFSARRPTCSVFPAKPESVSTILPPVRITKQLDGQPRRGEGELAAMGAPTGHAVGRDEIVERGRIDAIIDRALRECPRWRYARRGLVE